MGYQSAKWGQGGLSYLSQLGWHEQDPALLLGLRIILDMPAHLTISWCLDLLLICICKTQPKQTNTETAMLSTLIYPLPLLSVARLTVTWSRCTTWGRSMTYMYHVTTDQVLMHKISAYKTTSTTSITATKTSTHWSRTSPCATSHIPNKSIN